MRVLLTEPQIRDGVLTMAQQIHAAYEGTEVTIVGVMTGSVVLLADLIRCLELPLRVGVVQASSYRGGRTERGPLTVNADFLPELTGRHVLILDDIFDTGHTLDRLKCALTEFGPKSLRAAVLLRKQGRQQVEGVPDFVAFSIPNEFVVGYGLDYQDRYRNLPYIGALERDDLTDCQA